MSVLAILLAIAGGSLLFLLTGLFFRRPGPAIALLLLFEVGNAALITPGFAIGGVHVYLQDLFTVALFFAAIARIYAATELAMPPKALIAVIGLLLLGLARGIVTLGLQVAVNDDRELLQMLSAAIFFATFPITPSLIRAFRNWLLAAATFLSISAFVYWGRHGFATFTTSGTRALDGLQALIVLTATIVVFVFPPTRKPLVRWVVPVVGVLVVLLSTQRTVWAAGFVACVVLLLARQRHQNTGSTFTRRFLLVAAGAVVLVVVFFGPTGIRTDVTAGYQQTSVSQPSTFSWRIQGWSIILNRQIAGPTSDLLIGSPSGTTNTRIIGGQVTNAPVHSEYLESLTHTGLAGVALLLYLCLSCIGRIRRKLRTSDPFIAEGAVLFLSLLALDMIYFVGYSEGAFVGLLLGLACGFAAHVRHAHAYQSPVHETTYLPALTKRPLPQATSLAPD